MADLGFNPEQYEEEEIQPVPPGKYRAVVSETAFVDLKNYAGKGCRVTFTLLDGAKGRKVFSLYSIYHTDPDKQATARQIFARLCRVCLGHAHPRDTDELLRHQLVLELDVYEKYNNIKKIFPVESAKEQTSPQRKPVSRPADPVSAPLPRIEPEPSYSRPAPTAADCPF